MKKLQLMGHRPWTVGEQLVYNEVRDWVGVRFVFNRSFSQPLQTHNHTVKPYGQAVRSSRTVKPTVSYSFASS